MLKYVACGPSILKHLSKVWRRAVRVAVVQSNRRIAWGNVHRSKRRRESGFEP